MDKESLPPELEGFLNKVKLKEPPRELMSDYLSGVNAKIDRGVSGKSFGFPQTVVLLLAGAAFVAGVVYLLAFHPKKDTEIQIAPAVVSRPLIPEESAAQTIERAVPKVAEQLSLEDQLTILEALGEESEKETLETIGNEELLDEAAFLDDIEFSGLESIQAPAAGI